MINERFCLTKKYQKTITVYEFSYGFYVEVHKDEICTELYVSHENYGVKYFAFGACGLQEGAEEEIILQNIETMILEYQEQYFDDLDI